MKKFFISLALLITVASSIYGAAIETEAKKLKSMLKHVQDKDLSDWTKKCILIGYIDKAPLDCFNWVPHFMIHPQGIKEIDSVLSCGDNESIQKYISLLDNSKKEEVIARQKEYKKIAKEYLDLTFDFYKGVYGDKRLMAKFLFNNRFRDVAYPPAIMEGYWWKESDLRNHPKLGELFLDRVIRLSNKQLEQMLLFKDPHVIQNAFEQGILSLHLAVQIKSYDIVRMILEGNPARINDRDVLDRYPGYYLDPNDNKMIMLLKYFQH